MVYFREAMLDRALPADHTGRDTLRHFLFALLLSSDAVLVLLHGAGVGGSLVSGAFLIGTTAMVLCLGNASRFLLNQLDVLFALLVLSVAVGFTLGLHAVGTKEIALFLLTLASYPVGRLIPRGAMGPIFAWTILAIVGIGSIATALALVARWGDQMSKPAVFGFHHASNVFMAAMGFVLIWFASGPLTAHRTRMICAAFAVPLFVFSVAMVRFALVALAVSIYTAARSARPPHRRYVYAIFAMVIATSVAGTLTRYETWATLGNYIISNAHSSETGPWKPRSECGVIVNDSIGVRAVVWRDAVNAIPSAGLFGRGLNRIRGRFLLQGDVAAQHRSTGLR